MGTEVDTGLLCNDSPLMFVFFVPLSSSWSKVDLSVLEEIVVDARRPKDEGFGSTVHFTRQVPRLKGCPGIRHNTEKDPHGVTDQSGDYRV